MTGKDKTKLLPIIDKERCDMRWFDGETWSQWVTTNSAMLPTNASWYEFKRIKTDDPRPPPPGTTVVKSI